MKFEKKSNRGMRARQSVYFTLTVLAAVFGISGMLVISAIASNGLETKTDNNIKATVMAAAAAPQESSNQQAAGEIAQMAEEVFASQDKYGEINTDDVNFRDKPSTDSTVICILPYGSQHQIISDENNGWIGLYVEGVGEGFVSSDFVDVKSGKMRSVTDEDRKAIERGIANAAAYEAELDAWLGDEAEEETAEETEYYQDEEIVYDYEEDDYSSEEAYVIEDYYQEDSYEECYEENDWYEEDSWYQENDRYEEDSWYQEDAWDEPSYDEPDYSQADDEYYEEDYYEEEYYEEVSYADSLRAQVVDYACSFAGWLPYVWGGHSLVYGADCSGFLAAVYAQFGYNLSYASDVMSYQGRSVSLSDAKPGDIIVYPGHVTMYIGNGLKVHSPYPGTTVSIDSIYYESILDVRRIIED